MHNEHQDWFLACIQRLFVTRAKGEEGTKKRQTHSSLRLCSSYLATPYMLMEQYCGDTGSNKLSKADSCSVCLYLFFSRISHDLRHVTRSTSYGIVASQIRITKSHWLDTVSW